MSIIFKKPAHILIIIMAVALLLCGSASPVYADTDGSEIQITNRPDLLILQLGPQWAGVEFELKTDAGVFPVPVVVDPSGILTMDLGGSKTYTLSCILSAIPIPSQESIAEPAATNQQPPPPSNNPLCK
jgi:hypothetical protein